jgi:hypothetical protein
MSAAASCWLRDSSFAAKIPSGVTGLGDFREVEMVMLPPRLKQEQPLLMK